MKAPINGITIEGTPEEIAAYQRIKAEEARQKDPFKLGIVDAPHWNPQIAQRMSPEVYELARKIAYGSKMVLPCGCIGSCTNMTHSNGVHM